MRVSVLVRGKWVELDGVKVRQDSTNAYTLEIPLDPAVCKRVRRAQEMDAWDGAEFLLDDQETAPGVAAGQSKRGISVSVWTL